MRGLLLPADGPVRSDEPFPPCWVLLVPGVPWLR